LIASEGAISAYRIVKVGAAARITAQAMRPNLSASAIAWRAISVGESEPAAKSLFSQSMELEEAAHCPERRASRDLADSELLSFVLVGLSFFLQGAPAR
jgi:hypothetical protein